MGNIIALVWDFDKTLIKGYMQDPVFRHYGVDANEFWKEVNKLPEFYKKQGVKVNKDTIYLNQFIREANGGRFDGLNNEKLREFGKELEFYEGIPEIFTEINNLIEQNSQYKEYNIKVEHYIVSTGMTEIIKGSKVAEFIKSVWGCELIEKEGDGAGIISEIGYTLDNTSKTRALFEINKGIPQNPEIDVNSKMPHELRRVRFENMIYIADGPSDVPAFSVVKSYGGSTFAVYPNENEKAFKQVERLRKDGRVDMYAEADYTKGTTAYLWITNKISELAENIRQTEKRKLTASVSDAPTHII